MANDTFKVLMEVINERKENPMEGSYTCYLFEQGLDKILKKCGEECAEVIIAAKGENQEELKEEICDLIYHLFVLMSQQGVTLEEITRILDKRSEKIRNRKVFHQVNKDS